MSVAERIRERVGGRGLRLPAWLSARALVLFVAGLAVLYAAPLVLSIGDYTHNVMGLTFMFMAAALAWNWLGGYVGQISFGHAAMFGVGGFVAARLALTLELPFWVAWSVGGLVAGVYALLWGHPTLRLSYWLRRSRIGLGLIAIKEDVEAAGDVGVNATFYQDLVLFLSGTVVGVCGGFYASYQAFIDPQDMFSFDRSIGFILMAVIGGIGTILGPALGAIVFVMLQEFLLATYPQLYLGLYGLLLILVILFEPLGLTGLLLRIARRLGYRPAAGVAAGGIASSSSAAEGEPEPVLDTPSSGRGGVG
jgi:branched-chain amino acid transport system permease protein